MAPLICGITTGRSAKAIAPSGISDRIPNAFYGAYVRDLDGNKLCFMEMKFG